jgi:F-type H+-transporting ATPase subunit epsilon
VVTKIIAEAEHGVFCLLPQHIDFVAALVPAILSFEAETGEEVFVAI